MNPKIGRAAMPRPPCQRGQSSKWARGARVDSDRDGPDEPDSIVPCLEPVVKRFGTVPPSIVCSAPVIVEPFQRGEHARLASNA
jgi:hypothetical protein